MKNVIDAAAGWMVVLLFALHLGCSHPPPAVTPSPSPNPSPSASLSPSPSSSPSPSPSCLTRAPLDSNVGKAIPDQWIVELSNDITDRKGTTALLAARHGLQVIAIYDALEPYGFAVRGSAAAIEQLRCEPSVRRVTADGVAEAHGQVSAHSR